MSQPSPHIQTVTGPLAPERLGPTLMHEHLLCDITPPDLAARTEAKVEIRLDNIWSIRHHWCAHPGNNRLDDPDLMAAELQDYRSAGGGAVVELTTAGIGPRRAALRELSLRTEVPIVAGCGFYTEPFLPERDRGRDLDSLAKEMMSALDPAGATPSGIIGEIGCSDSITEVERRVLRAAAIAQQASGAAINVHPSRRPEGLFEAIDLLRGAGANLSRVIMSHVDRTVFDEPTLFRLADTGVIIEYDFFGIESSYYPFDTSIDLPNDGQRVRWIRTLIERGHLEQITVSQDICTRTRLRRLGGHGYGHLLQHVVPLMQRRGLSQYEVDALLIQTPRRLLSLP